MKHWKDGAEVALVNSQKGALESRKPILETTNGNCAMDIEGVRNGAAVIVQQVEEREKAASDAMKGAQLPVAQHSAKAAAIKNLLPVPPAPEAQVLHCSGASGLCSKPPSVNSPTPWQSSYRLLLCPVETPAECNTPTRWIGFLPRMMVTINRAFRQEIEERWACEIRLKAAVKECNKK